MDAWLNVVERDWMWLKYLALLLEALRSVGKNLQGTMASTRQNIAPFIMIVAWFKVPLLQKEWLPCWMWLKCDWTWLKYSWLISIRMWLLSIEISLQSISITINQDQSLLEFYDDERLVRADQELLQQARKSLLWAGKWTSKTISWWIRKYAWVAKDMTSPSLNASDTILSDKHTCNSKRQ